MTSSEPQGRISSAGWKISRTRPSSSPRSASWASSMPTPSRTEVCTSCPQAWQTPSTVDRYGHVLGVVQRQGVDVGAQRDDRAVRPAVDVADHAVALGQQARVQPGQRQLPGDQRGRLELVAGELRVRVEVTARGDQPRYPEREQVVQLEGQGLGPGWRLRPGRRQLAAGGQRQRTRHVEFSITRNGWIIGDSRQPRPPTVTLRNLVTVVIGPRSVTNALLGALVKAGTAGRSRSNAVIAPHLLQRVTDRGGHESRRQSGPVAELSH